MRRLFLSAVILSVGLFAGAATAVPITGEVLPGSASFSPNSTNALNFAQQTPGREGQPAPFVTLSDSRIGEVDLLFQQPGAGLAFFEIRIDGVATGTTAHPVAIGDTIHTGGVAVPAGSPSVLRTFAALGFVEVRLALGGERDFDFDWTAFRVQPVPLPAGILLLGSAIGIVGFVGRRRRAVV